MRRQIIVVFLSLFWLLLAPAAAAERGALFKVTGNGHTMHLFGTMHAGLPEFYPLEPRIVTAVAGASVLALEIDPVANPAAMVSAVQRHAVVAPGSAEGVAPPALKPRLEGALRKAGLAPGMIGHLKPWLLATLLALAEFTAQGYRPDLAVDSHLAQLARAHNVPVIELETAEAQLSLFSNLPAADQWRFLDETVTMGESGKQAAEAREVVQAWGRADQAGLDALARRLEQDQTFSGRFVQEVVLERRNGPMADKLQQLLASKDKAVAAVGVLHLLGKNSVPALLRARGLTVERVY